MHPGDVRPLDEDMEAEQACAACNEKSRCSELHDGQVDLPANELGNGCDLDSFEELLWMTWNVLGFVGTMGHRHVRERAVGEPKGWSAKSEEDEGAAAAAAAAG